MLKFGTLSYLTIDNRCKPLPPAMILKNNRKCYFIFEPKIKNILHHGNYKHRSADI